MAPAGASPRAAHDLLLDLASTLVDDPVLTHDESGRPHIPGLAVSLTRTPHRIAVAATYDGPLGIDLEELEPRDVTALANRWFTPQELTWLNHQPDHLNAFLHLWTAKEATGKALGLDLRASVLRRPAVTPDASGLVVKHVAVQGAVLAVAMPIPEAEVVLRVLPRITEG